MIVGLITLIVLFILIIEAISRARYSILEVRKGKLIFIKGEIIDYKTGIFMRLKEKK